MRIKLLICALLTTTLFADIKPLNNSTINYIHVLFEWGQITETDNYNLTVSTNGVPVININTANLFHIDKDNIEWNTSYSWQVCNASQTVCSDTYSFSTNTEIDLGELNLTVYDLDQYYDGVTIFGNLTPAFSAAIDENGRQIWHSGGLNTFCYFKNDYDGEYKFYGGKYNDDPINILPGIEFDINGNIIFEEPELEINANWAFVQHEILKINDDEYLFFIPEDQLHPVPSCATTNNCQWPGGEYDWEDDFFDGQYVYWRGEKIILWNEDTQSITWEWDAFDYIPLDDYDALVNWDAYPTYGYYDWTHFNALAYDGVTNTIYVSSRHLSRIYKIDLNSGNILWSMGYDLTGNGNVDIELNDANGNYNGFTFQHGLQILENGNIITLDNGNISSLLFPEYIGNNKTRALEIAVDESSNTAEIVWEYILDENLYGALSGNVQKLDNGNYLITTIGDYGHTLEINNNGELVSDLQYKIDNYVTGKMYRADRIKSIYPHGCTSINACNYNANARIDDGTCEYPVNNCSCESADTDNDGICDDEDLCPNNWDPYQNDRDGDGLADACEDFDDDGDGLIDCWYFWYPEQQHHADFILGENCDDNALEITANSIPADISLTNAYPNPFNPTVQFNVETSIYSSINIDIYSVNGQFIDSIHSGYIVPGIHSFEWDGTQYSSGTYIINLTWDNNSIEKKVVLLK